MVSSGSEEFDDVFDSFVGAVIGGFEAAVGSVLRIGVVVEAAIGERAAQSLVEEQQEQRHLDAFGAEPIGIAGAVALDQAVAFELTQVVAQLVEAIGALGELEGRKHGVMDLLGGPAADMG